MIYLPCDQAFHNISTIIPAMIVSPAKAGVWRPFMPDARLRRGHDEGSAISALKLKQSLVFFVPWR